MKEIFIDNFAGGGGASTGIELAIGRSVDIAINHDPDAISMHKVNHPDTRHYCESVWDVDPLEACNNKSVGLAWFSPDCKHFSKAKGGKPVDKNIRGLAWVTIRWALLVRPRVIALENVEEFKTWGPLLSSGYPDKLKKGTLFQSFVKILSTGVSDDDEGYLECLHVLNINVGSSQAKKLKKGLGYKVDWRELQAFHYGAATTRKRFFLVARCDDKQIMWPEKTHDNPNSIDVKEGKVKPWVPAHTIIDWSIPGNSIFERKKELSPNTLRRIARGIDKFVLNDPQPFIVRIGQTGFGKDRLQYPINQPLTTITTKAEHLLVTPTIMVNTSNHPGSSVKEPVKTITTGEHHALIQPVLIQMGYGDAEGKRVLNLSKPLGTITAGGNKFGLATAFLAQHYGGNYNGSGKSMESPLGTVTTVDHHALVVAFLTKYYGNDVGQSMNMPLHTITTKDKFGLVMVKGTQYKIIDITMRMLQPHELFAAHKFPKRYIIDTDIHGKKYSKAKQIARCGNSVPPPFAEAIVRANLPEYCTEKEYMRRTG